MGTKIRIPDDIPNKIWVLHEDMADMADGVHWLEPGAYSAFYHIPDELVERLRGIGPFTDTGIVANVRADLLAIIDREG